jgi:SAM-dependent methyltransferase
MKIISKTKSKADKIVKALVDTFKEKKHFLSLKKIAPDLTPDYDHYLTGQLKRTIIKNTNSLLPRTEILVNLILEKGQPPVSSKILCIGCRNTAELDYFQSMGLQNVIGIDLFSEDPRIRVMDMHKMTFADDAFDIVYSAHSLEHSYDIEQVTHEIIRVARDQAIIAIEVPVRYTITDADRYDLKNTDGVIALFSHQKTKILWSDDLETRTPTNNEGTPIVRVIFRIEK